MPEARIGVIGGTGLYEIEGLSDIEEVRVKTPFGDPSDSIVVGILEGTGIAFLPRHGRGHRINPTELPSRANIYALKSLGVEWIISINSAGSLKEELAPRHLVIPDQIIDRTRGRVSSFFGDGLVVHIPFADPFCPLLSEILHRAAQDAGATVHKGGTFIAMEGPQFSTRAESRLYRSWGGSIIGMTVLPEAKLAREAEICYASVACVTDYDCWHDEKEPVTAEIILAVLAENISTAKEIIKIASPLIPGRRDCECASALMTGMVTPPKLIPERMKRELALLIGRYVQ
ncbi:MAG: S-methyl-5'-thioadenosine phosphorylase [Dehalococcoidia bacterium]|nr:S-methyl-5'-thioadenosine phosphorylase [Chloroflexota bacterium]MBT9160177.1 S-methyl-5'-thioadenosine phosphorylase [Chloroflexota bacterium]MBT9162169.1 S-methyl-5'-thioadenosine phosphorylase [Chloroflexota bacterium]MBT9163109.1 S-methyl-5'-thioadenosine phosphorylase [Chloroflexota bacterium]